MQDSVYARIEDGKRIAVHCRARMGRTNLMLAGYLVYLGTKPDDALYIVKEKRRYQSINEEQEKALKEYSYMLNNQEV